jgi:hypothetical protein
MSHIFEETQDLKEGDIYKHPDIKVTNEVIDGKKTGNLPYMIQKTTKEFL